MQKRIDCLDGLRGLAALWVLIGHSMSLSGFKLPLLSKPDLGVDLFIYLSGFLMVYQYDLRKQKEDWGAPFTWVSFWVRRFFRLSPLYFLLLVCALLAGHLIYADRVLIDTFLQRTPQLASRYTDASLLNFGLHFTYLYGLVPQYAYRTPLPDWSLGLEMQFYLVFPALVLMARRAGWIVTAIMVAVGAFTIYRVTNSLGIRFPMPSFLPLKMPLFLAGMMIAAALNASKLPYLLLAMLLALIPGGGPYDIEHVLIREVILGVFFALVHWRSISIVDRVSSMMGAHPFHWLGELSYGVYLVHLLFIHAIAAWTIRMWGSDMQKAERFVVVFGLGALASYGLAYLTYRLVEQPGQELGRSVLNTLSLELAQSRLSRKK